MSDLSLEIRPRIERDAREYLGRYVEAYEQLLALAVEMLEPDNGWHGHPIDGNRPADSLIAVEAARGLKTYRAVLHLCLSGFGQQAAMLDRSLFEGTVVVHWVRANPELAAKRWDQHFRHNKAMWHERFTEAGIPVPEIQDLPGEDERRELNEIFGRWGTKLWPGLPMHKLVHSIEDQWDEPEELRKTFAIVHADNVETLHTSMLALSRMVMSEDDGHLQAESGSSLNHVEKGLFGGLWPYGHTLMLLADHFEIEGRERVQPLVEVAKKQFYPLAENEKPSRNESCPCGRKEVQEVPRLQVAPSSSLSCAMVWTATVGSLFGFKSSIWG